MSNELTLMKRIGQSLKQIWTIEGGRPGFEDRDNFVTNRVTVAEYNDTMVASPANAMALAAVWACVRLISGNISSLPLMVYKQGPSGREVAHDHPLYEILHNTPNADQTALNFWQFISASLELQGNAYAPINRRNDKSVSSLAVPVAPDCVKVKRLTNGALQYEVSTGTGSPKTYRQEDMLHVRGFGGNPLGGLSTLAFGRRAFGLASAIDASARTTFRNGVRPSGVLTVDKTLNKEQRELAERLLQERYQGSMNAGIPMLLDNGVKWAALSINPDDAQMLESRAFSVEEICRFFGVPPHMIGHTEKSSSWGTGVEQMTIGFIQFTLRERLKNIESTLEKQLLTAADRAAGVRIEFNIEGLLRGDSKARSEFYKAALGDTQRPGWMTRNEVRKLENLEPIDGWDEPIPLIGKPQPNDPNNTEDPSGSGQDGAAA
jgi:HK97 family phage portal protein